MHDGAQVVIGIGINVNMQNALKKEIDQAWNSLQKITGQYIDRNLWDFGHFFDISCERSWYIY